MIVCPGSRIWFLAEQILGLTSMHWAIEDIDVFYPKCNLQKFQSDCRFSITLCYEFPFFFIDELSSITYRPTLEEKKVAVHVDCRVRFPSGGGMLATYLPDKFPENITYVPVPPTVEKGVDSWVEKKQQRRNIERTLFSWSAPRHIDAHERREDGRVTNHEAPPQNLHVNERFFKQWQNQRYFLDGWKLNSHLSSDILLMASNNKRYWAACKDNGYHTRAIHGKIKPQTRNRIYAVEKSARTSVKPDSDQNYQRSLYRDDLSVSEVIMDSNEVIQADD